MADERNDRGRRRDRRPPDRRRGRTRPLSERAARFAARASATDRSQRFERRRAEVAEIRRARRRGRIAAAVASWVGTVLALVGGGWLFAGTTGAAFGAGAVAVLAVGLILVRWLARRRGAAAWDWTIQRHRLLGNPFEQTREPTDQRRGSGLDLFRT